MEVFTGFTVAFFAAFLLQLLLCTRAKKRIWRGLPLIVCGVWIISAWLALSALRDISINIAAFLLLIILLGFNLLGGVTLAWFVYGVITLVRKIIHP